MKIFYVDVIFFRVYMEQCIRYMCPASLASFVLNGPQILSRMAHMKTFGWKGLCPFQLIDELQSIYLHKSSVQWHNELPKVKLLIVHC